MISELAMHSIEAKTPSLVGLNGCQAAGKSTLADYMRTVFKLNHGLNVAVLSLDDFYFTLQERKRLAGDIYPLLQTRGLPGTDDIALALETIRGLQHLPAAGLYIPRFDKAADDRVLKDKWEYLTEQPDIILSEGWSLGSKAVDASELITAINFLEREHDQDGLWRQYVNLQLATSYPRLFEKIQLLIMLKAPSFNCVYQWRLEQEEKLRAKFQGLLTKGNKLMQKYRTNKRPVGSRFSHGYCRLNWKNSGSNRRLLRKNVR